MRAAVLDLGTNTFNLLIADINGEQIDIITRTREIVKLGEGGLADNRMTPEAFDRGVNAISNHLQTISEHQCNTIRAVATSGIRSTTNGQAFIEHIYDNFQLKIKVIDGDREAELIYKGVKLCSPIEKNCLIMDIGGGSTEFIIADQEGIKWKQSFLLGASRLKELFKPEDPISEACIQRINSHFGMETRDLIEALEKYPCQILLGSSGSFDTFAEMELHRIGAPERFDKEDTVPIDITEFQNSYQFLITSRLEERLQTPGIIAMRADMIVISGLLTKYIIEMADIRSIALSKFSLKEGLMSEIMASHLSQS